MMKSRIVMLAAVLLLLLSGCKMSQFFSRRVEKTNVEQRADVRETSSVKTDIHTIGKLSEQTQLSLDITEVITITKWSIPDSSGQQFPTETTNITRHSVTGQNRTTESEQEKKGTTETLGTKEDKSVVNAESEIKTDEKIKTKPASTVWITWAVVILSLGVVVLVFFILKRYRIL